MVNYRIVFILFLALMAVIFMSGLPGRYIPFSYLLFIALFGTVFLGYKILASDIEKETNTLAKEITNNQNCLIKNGVKVPVDFKDCTIISNTSNPEVPVKTYSFGQADSRSLDGLYDPVRTLEIKQVNECRIQFNYILDGEMVTFSSPVIEKDKTTLLFLLAMQKHTKLYYDAENPENFYFDLSFLEN